MEKKIIMLIPNLDFGGAQRVFSDQAQILAEKYEVIECSFNLEGGHAFPSGNKLISLGVPGGVNFLDKAYRFFQRCWKVYQLKRKERPVFSISHLEGADYVNILSGKGKKVLVIHGSKIHDKEMDSSYGGLRKHLLLPFLYKRADLIIAVSEGIRQELIQHYGIPSEKVKTIHNSFDVKRLKNLGGECSGLPKKTGNPTFKLITSGRIAIPKNHIPLLYIVKHLKEDYRLPVQLFIAGDGPLKNKLIAVTESLSLSFAEVNEINIKPESDVFFLGYQKNPFSFYKEMDLFVFPSAWEGFPMALGEAMALGLPVVSSDCPGGGPQELLDPDWKDINESKQYPKFTFNGVLLPVPKVEEKETIKIWGEAIFKVLNNKLLREKIGLSAQNRMDLLDVKFNTEKWHEVEEMLSKRK